MKFGGVSRHIVGGKKWSLRMIAKSVGVSTASGARGSGLLSRFSVLDPE